MPMACSSTHRSRTGGATSRTIQIPKRSASWYRRTRITIAGARWPRIWPATWSGTGRARSPSAGSRNRHLLRRQRQSDRERGAHAGLRRAADQAAVGFDDTLADVQAEPAAAFLVFAAGRVVRLE